LELGIAVGFRGDFARSWALHQEALAAWLALGNRFWPSNVLIHLGIVAHERGDPAATALLSEAIARCEAGNQAWLASVALASLGSVVLDGGAVDEAAGWFGRSLALHAQHGDGAVTVLGLLGMARVAVARQRMELAIRLLGAARAAHERYGTLLYPRVRAQLAEAETTLRQRLEAEPFGAAWAAGRSLGIADAIAEACGLAEAKSNAADATPANPFDLSLRELEVLRLVVAGHSNAEIAEALFISRRTAATHISHIYGKLGLAGRAEAIAFAHRHGLA
jgi:non-specific serine/threonine protein kinase